MDDAMQLTCGVYATVKSLASQLRTQVASSCLAEQQQPSQFGCPSPEPTGDLGVEQVLHACMLGKLLHVWSYIMPMQVAVMYLDLAHQKSQKQRSAGWLGSCILRVVHRGSSAGRIAAGGIAAWLWCSLAATFAAGMQRGLSLDSFIRLI